MPDAFGSNQIVDIISELDRKVHWLSAWTIHNANHIRPSRDGLKVGGHQASSASLATILSALYFGVLRSHDRVAVKPHASPAFHAIQYLYGRQTLDQLISFRAFGGAQSYPSRTKDKDDVDFSTGSVGLGVAITAFASVIQDYLEAHDWLPAERRGRMIALLGDAELDEGNIYEAVLEGEKHDLRNTWWIVDYNRQSLDAITSDSMSKKFHKIFSACGWDIVELKYGRKLQQAFADAGGLQLKHWIDTSPNDLYSALTFQGGAAWRKRLLADIGHSAEVRSLLDRYDDTALHELMTNLGGHDLGFLLDTFNGIDDERPKLFIAYTIKGIGLPFQGHKDNHAGLLTEAQMELLRGQMGVSAGEEWDRFSGLPRDSDSYLGFLRDTPFSKNDNRRFSCDRLAVPAEVEFPQPKGRQSTQVAFGKILNDIARAGGPLADAIVTMSPDVTVSTNLGGWVNQRGLFSRNVKADLFRETAIASPQRWAMAPTGQHIELGIAENNLFLLLGAAGLADSLFGHRLIPVGTVYDPFINRGLDALNYACYQDARFMLVATPSGLTLGPEGGAHQSIHTPLIGMAQDKLTYFEPTFVDELAQIMRWGFEFMQQAYGQSIYLRLSTRPLDQPNRVLSQSEVHSLLEGAYWRVAPGPQAELIIVYCGAVAPEAQAAFDEIRLDDPQAGLLAVTSPDRLHRGWSASLKGRARGLSKPSHIEELLGQLPRSASLITVMDGPPSTLSWLGGIQGHRVVPLGLDKFGQSGDLIDLYDEYRLDAASIVEAAATAVIRAAGAP